MQTIEGSFHPELILEHYRYLLAHLPVGEKNKISKDDLYLKYKEALANFDEDYKTGKKKYLSPSSFQRITRMRCEEAREAGWKVLYSTERNDSGIWICKDENEYNEFKDMQVRKITKSIQEIANLEKKTLKEIIENIFFARKKKTGKLSDNSLFDGIQIDGLEGIKP